MLLALPLTLTLATHAGRLTDPSWIRLSRRVTEADLDCAGYDYKKQWAVTLRDEVPVVSVQIPVRREDPLPFAVPKHKDRSGDRHVLKVDGGWIVGFDAGEFGGGLWFTATGADWRQLRPPSEPAAPDDPLKAENVQGLAVVEGQTLALMGLDHLTGRSGRVFKVASISGQWSLGAGSVLDSCPEAWAIVGDHLEVVTEGGLWIVRPDASADLAVPLEFGMAYPRSLAVAQDGRRYVGMRRYVLMLEKTATGWRDTWYGPTRCPHSRRNEKWECSCTK